MLLSFVFDWAWQAATTTCYAQQYISVYLFSYFSRKSNKPMAPLCCSRRNEGKIYFSNSFHVHQCHSEAKNSCNSRMKGGMTLRFWFFSFSWYPNNCQISKKSVTMMYPNLPDFLRKWLLTIQGSHIFEKLSSLSFI